MKHELIYTEQKPHFQPNCFVCFVFLDKIRYFKFQITVFVQFTEFVEIETMGQISTKLLIIIFILLTWTIIWLCSSGR